MTVQQLAQLELAYAPQFNGPKDPLNIAGFVASNMMAGLVKMVRTAPVAPVGTQSI